MTWPKKPQPALILTLQRTGGTFLAHCLSNHPAIFCPRGEPLAKRSQWCKMTRSSTDTLHLIFNQTIYQVAMCKLINNHAFNDGVWEYITGSRGGPWEIKLIWLERENIVAQAISHEINAGRRLGTITGHPTHAYKPVEPPPVKLNPAQLVKRCADEAGRAALAKAKIKKSGLACLYLTYKEITGASNATAISTPVARRICKFLGVEYAVLCCRMHKVHTRSYSETITNWPKVKKALLKASYGDEVAEIEAGKFC